MASKRIINNVFSIGKRTIQNPWKPQWGQVTRMMGSTRNVAQRRGWTSLVTGLGVGCLFGSYVVFHNGEFSISLNAHQRELTRREQRFHDFASCEVRGQVVMTPYDFIESLIENDPKMSRRSKIKLSEKKIKKIISRTPSIENGSTTLFRELHHDGIITYSEYLFLVTILTKSNAGLKIAMKMMDVNGDQMINLEEFRRIELMINESAACDHCTHGDDNSTGTLITTIHLHLFGEDGKEVVSYEDFFKFMDNIQVEVLELEFHEHSNSLQFISEMDFATILLRNTTLTEQEFVTYLDRLKSRLDLPQGISLAQFKAFNKFLSNIDDFITAVNMMNQSGADLDKEFFHRAVNVVTGEVIDSYVIDIVFHLFDVDEDGRLGKTEFIGIMKDRLKRGFGKFPNMKGVQGFKHCLKKEMVK